jgi:propanol-preferring alcohol dehydrogenase
MADLLVTDARRLVPAAGLDPVAAAPLTDAALTSLHAVTRCQSLDEPGSVAVVVGVGGLGHVAVQLLRALTPCIVVAVDTRPVALDLATRCGAHHVVHTGHDAGTDVARTVRAVTDGRGADAVLDFVVTTATATLSAELLAAGADLVLVGGGGGRLEIAKPGPLPPDTRISLPSWGTRPELARLVELARDGVLRTETTTYALADADTAFADLERGAVAGRAVLVP